MQLEAISIKFSWKKQKLSTALWKWALCKHPARVCRRPHCISNSFLLLFHKCFDGLMYDNVHFFLLPFMKHMSYSSLACLLQRKWLPPFPNNSYFSVLEEKCGLHSFQGSRKASVSPVLCFLPWKYPLIFWLDRKQTIPLLMKEHNGIFSSICPCQGW